MRFPPLQPGVYRSGQTRQTVNVIQSLSRKLLNARKPARNRGFFRFISLRGVTCEQGVWMVPVVDGFFVWTLWT
jgi:hypothetical protein